jgi:hypothetical protein
LIQLEGLDPLVLELIEVTVLGSKEPNSEWGDRRPFSLLFQGPKAPMLHQQVYTLEHEAMGQLGLFLVPLGTDKTGARYEAVFT